MWTRDQGNRADRLWGSESKAQKPPCAFSLAPWFSAALSFPKLKELHSMELLFDFSFTLFSMMSGNSAAWSCSLSHSLGVLEQDPSQQAAGPTWSCYFLASLSAPAWGWIQLETSMAALYYRYVFLVFIFSLPSEQFGRCCCWHCCYKASTNPQVVDL